MAGALLALGCSDDPAVSGTTGGGAAGGGGAGGAGAGGSGGNDWSCIGTLGPKRFAPGASVGNLLVAEFQDDSPLAGVTVKVCGASDIACANALDEGVTDAQGRVTLDVTNAEQRYLDVSGPGTLDALSFNNGPPASDPFNELIRVIAPETFTLIESLMGISADPTRGHAGVQANDCQGAIGVGVTFSLDNADADTATAYFTTAATPNPLLEETSADGRAAIANIPVGTSVLTATIAATGQVIGSRTFFVRAGAIHYPACIEADPEA
jgi:hypothetical protein